MTSLFKSLLMLTIVLFAIVVVNAQAELSVQGILKKSNGTAVDDGAYNITFKLYEDLVGGTAIWEEVQSGVEVSSGIYSAVLGQNPTFPLDVPFDQAYYLGVTIGSSELSPRIVLTSAPYALSLRGNTNQFPSSGKVLADSIQVNGGILAKGGAPGVDGVNRNGYAFTGNNGDNDSGLFSTGDSKVSLYVDNVEKLTVTDNAVQVNNDLSVSGTFNTAGLNVTNNGSVSYNGKNDWRLVETDYFDNSNDSEGWRVYDKLTGYSMGWNNPTSLGAAPITGMGSFIGNVMLPTSNDHVLKKQFSIPGSYTQIKVKFRYYFIDTWGFGGGDRAWAAFSNNASGGAVRVGWQVLGFGFDIDNGDVSGGATPLRDNSNFFGTATRSDNWQDVEMTARADGSNFWIFIGAAVDMDINDERYAVGAIEVYVK